MGKLEGKVAIVTGAARGLGRAYAHRLASLGAKVAVSDIDLKSYAEFSGEVDVMTAESTVDEIKRGGGEAIGVVADVTDPDAVNSMVGEVAKAWGRVDILVANAGGNAATAAESQRVTEMAPSASTVPHDLLRAVVDRNLIGTIYACQAVAPGMRAQGSGRIITVGSYAGSVAQRGGHAAHYGAAKAAVVVYTRYLAQELGPHGITVNCIAPGFIATARVAEMSMAGINLEEIPLRRHGTTEDCAGVIEFLATDLSRYITGAVIPIDGGWNPGST